MGGSLDAAEDASATALAVAIPGTTWTATNNLRYLIPCVSTNLRQGPPKFCCVLFWFIVDFFICLFVWVVFVFVRSCVF